jgi:mRNA interferase MazF
LVGETFVPDTGNVVWISLDPAFGHEQAGRRPFLVLSKRSYNAKTSMMVGVPVTSKRKAYPFQVDLRTDGAISGVAMVDQIRSVDWRLRIAEHAGDADQASLRNVRLLLATFLELR